MARLQCVCGFNQWYYPHYDTERRWMRCVACNRKDTEDDQQEVPEHVWITVPSAKREPIAKEHGLRLLIPIC